VIIDTSTVIAILKGEPEEIPMLRVISRADVIRISAATLVELFLVVDRLKDPVLSNDLNDWLAASNLMVEPLTEDHARIARDANRRYGKGSGHPAKLNLGDCFSYALAIEKKEPLLFKGHDFSQTDVLVATY
jgi:ribonuclease VapC